MDPHWAFFYGEIGQRSYRFSQSQLWVFRFTVRVLTSSRPISSPQTISFLPCLDGEYHPSKHFERFTIACTLGVQLCHGSKTPPPLCSYRIFSQANRRFVMAGISRLSEELLIWSRNTCDQVAQPNKSIARTYTAWSADGMSSVWHLVPTRSMTFGAPELLRVAR